MTREQRIAEIKAKLAEFDRGMADGGCEAALMDFWRSAHADVRYLLEERENHESVCERFHELFLRDALGRVGIESSPRGFRHITETAVGVVRYSELMPTLAACVAGLREAAEGAMRGRFANRFGTTEP